jgi:hypothetical protein
VDVKLPDGTIVQNVPDGITQKDLLDTLAQNGYDVGPIQKKFMFTPGKEGLNQAAQEVGEKQNWLQKAATGIGNAAFQANSAVANLPSLLGAPRVVSKEALDVGNATQRGAGPIASNMAAGTNMAGAAAFPGAFSSVPRAMATTFATTPEDRLQAAITSGGLQLGVRGLTGDLIRPSEATKKLLAEGVTPTIGQNARGLPGKLNQQIASTEEKIQSVPLLGDFITSSRLRALDEFRNAALNKAAPAGTKITAKGDEGIKQLKGAYDEAYTSAFGNSQFNPGVQILRDLGKAPDKIPVPLSERGLKQYWDVVNRNALERIPQGGMPAQEAKRTIEGDLGALSRKFQNSSTMEEVAIGDALKGARDVVRQNMRSGMVPEDVAKLVALDKSYPAKKAVEKAADLAKGQLGGFSPYQLQTQSQPGSALRQLANVGQEILPTKFPNSYSAERIFLGNLLTGFGGTPAALGTAGAGYALAGPFGAAAGLAPLMYSKPFLSYEMGKYTPEMLRQLSPALAQGLLGFREQ